MNVIGLYFVIRATLPLSLESKLLSLHSQSMGIACSAWYHSSRDLIPVESCQLLAYNALRAGSIHNASLSLGRARTISRDEQLVMLASRYSIVVFWVVPGHDLLNFERWTRKLNDVLKRPEKHGPRQWLTIVICVVWEQDCHTWHWQAIVSRRIKGMLHLDFNLEIFQSQ